MNYDAIVIGAGLGGLTAGAKLAKEGKKILLIEQHSIPGGCATTFKRKDLKIEVGLHMIDGLDDGDPKQRIFEELGVLDNLEFKRVPEFYRFVKPGVDLIIPDNYEQAIEVLTEHFPAERKGILKFFKVILALRKEVFRVPRQKWKMLLSMPFFPFYAPNLMIRENITVGQFLDDLFDDENLKLVLLATLGYYHDNPYNMSLLYYSIAQGSFFSGGGYFIKGGSQMLSDYLASIIENQGGEVIYGHLVEEIIVEDGSATGVKYSKKSATKGEQQSAYGKCIVANAALPNVIGKLLKNTQAKTKLSNVVGNPEIAPSILSVYLGFKRTPKDLGNRYYSTVFFDGGISSQQELADYHHTDLSKRVFIFCDYSQLDSDLAPEGKSVGVLCAMDNISNWDALPKEQYEERKELAAQTMISRLDKHIPGIREEIEYYEVGTPTTIRRYTLNPEGTAYGYAQLPGQTGRKRVKIKSPIPNLFFASAWTEPGHGFTGAIISGYWCAEEILRK
ncbi:NAD(P)/FAD-dependent oxidoreductase [candidate division KSB1 bacterium]|nr:NAD(P)/FAD-dependent oxidoreductase [candidate division KSB1 bacterium]